MGTKSATATFVMTLVDPCLTTQLTIIDPDPFEDQTYILRAAQIDQIWNIDNLITKDTLVDCGALTVEFFNDDTDQSDLNAEIFLDDRTTASAFNLAVKPTEDTAKANEYPIKYRVYHTNYSPNIVTLAIPFVITTSDPCDKPVGLTESAFENQEYTITDDAKTYQIPVFTPDPSWCTITYSHSVTDTAISAAVAFNNDATVREFTFNNSADLSLCGLTSIDYTVTVNAEIGMTEKQTASQTFTLTLKNPCIDSNFVTLKAAVLLNQIYELHEHDPVGF